MNFEPLRPYGVKPIIRMIDFYKNNANNAHLLEFGLGKGKVLATSLNLLTNLTTQPPSYDALASNLATRH